MKKQVNRAKGRIRFTLKESKTQLEKKPNQESLINLHYSYGREMRFKYSTSYFSTYNNWDFGQQRIRNKNEIKNRHFVNNYLDDMEGKVKDIVSECDANQIPLTKEILKEGLDEFLNRHNNDEPEETSHTFYTYFDTFLERKSGVLALTTIRAYKQTLTYLKAFDKKEKATTNFDSINLDFYYSFTAFLEDKKLSKSTVGKHVKNIRSVMNSALDEGHTDNRKFKSKQFKVLSEQSNAIYLTEEEIKEIHNLDLSHNKRRELARDIFLIGCYTGQRVSDYNGIDYKDIFENDGITFVKIKQKKTNTVVDCPITVEMKDIMDSRHKGQFPKKMTEQHINIEIKKVAKKAGLKEKVKCIKTLGGKEVVEWLPKHKLVATHTARRSFCTNLYKKGVHIDYIMHFSGHKSIKEFYKYIRIEREEKSLQIAKSGFFNLASV